MAKAAMADGGRDAADMDAPLIDCRGVAKRFGDVQAVDGVSFALHPGEVVAVLGQSGCGKTTLLRLIAGFEALDAGEISVRGRVASSASLHEPPERRGIGMVFQEYALFPHMTVAQNAAFGLRGVAAGDRRRRVGDVLALVGLSGLEGRYPHELSGGQQQRAALARTLAPSPAAALFDEPFSNLDPGMRFAVRQDVTAILRDRAMAAIFVKHNVGEAFAVADRVGVMVDGRLEQMDAPEALYQRPKSAAVARLVGECDFIEGVMRGGGAAAETDIGVLPVACPAGDIADGARALVMARPHDFRIDADDGGCCVVEAHEFHGADTRIFARTPTGATLRCETPGYSPLPAGTRARLTPTATAAFLAYPAE